MNIHLAKVLVSEDHFNERCYSQILGVFSGQNYLQNLLKFTCSISNFDAAFLVFHQEPCCWGNVSQVFQSYENPQLQLDGFFHSGDLIQQDHCDFSVLSQLVHQCGLPHQRLVILDLKLNGVSIGYLILCDHKTEQVNSAAIQAIQDFAQSLVKILEMNLDHEVLKELYESEKSLSSSKTKYLQILSHDLRAPFHGLLGFTDVLVHERESLNDQEIQRIAEYLNDTTQSTFELLERVLKWVMADGGRLAYHPISFNLSDSAEIVSDVLSGLAQKKNIRLVNQVHGTKQVFADIHMVTSIIQNLVSNALKFTKADSHGVVMMRVETEPDYVHLYVQDTGLGMTQEQIDSLFEPKLTANVRGTDGESGAGLGLVLCKRFVDLNLGEISVSSKQHEGTTVKVSLPSSLLKQQ